MQASKQLLTPAEVAQLQAQPQNQVLEYESAPTVAITLDNVDAFEQATETCLNYKAKHGTLDESTDAVQTLRQQPSLYSIVVTSTRPPEDLTRIRELLRLHRQRLTQTATVPIAAVESAMQSLCVLPYNSK